MLLKWVPRNMAAKQQLNNKLRLVFWHLAAEEHQQDGRPGMGHDADRLVLSCLLPFRSELPRSPRFPLTQQNAYARVKHGPHLLRSSSCGGGGPVHGGLQRRRAADQGRQGHTIAAAADGPAAGRHGLLRPALPDRLQAVLGQPAAPDLCTVASVD